MANINGQNPGSLPYTISGFSALVTGSENESFSSEHKSGTDTSVHFKGTNYFGITSSFIQLQKVVTETPYSSSLVFTVNSEGDTTSKSFIKTGGTSTQYLMADGSVSVGGGSKSLQQVTEVGATTTKSISINSADSNTVPALQVTNSFTDAWGVIAGIGIKGIGAIGGYFIGDDNDGGGSGIYCSSTGGTGLVAVSVDGNGINASSLYGGGIYGYSPEGSGVMGNSSTGLGVYANSTDYVALYATSTNGKSIVTYGNGTVAIEANLGSSNTGLVVNSGGSSTGNPIVINKSGPGDVLIVNQLGEITASKFIKKNGTSSQYLMANGSTTTGNITSLNGLSNAIFTQIFATSSTGSDFSITSSGTVGFTGVHTFNLPDASATARGVITTGTQTIAGTKTFSSNPKIGIPYSSIAAIAGVASDGTLSPLYTGYYPNQQEISYVRGVTSSIQTQLNTKISGTLTTYYVPRASGATTLVDSQIYDTGSVVNIGDTSNTTYKLYVNGSIYSTADITAFSDQSVKNNIRSIDNVLERIKGSRGIIYDRTDIDAKDNIGFIAQELEVNFPELVTTNTDGTKAVKYQNMVAVLLEAIKEQQKQIDELKSK